MSQDRSSQAIGPGPDDPTPREVKPPSGAPGPGAAGEAPNDRPSWRTWRARHPLLASFVLLLAPALLVYLGVVLLQAAFATPQVALRKEGPKTVGGVRYEVIYPERVLRDGSLLTQQSLSIWVSAPSTPSLVVSPSLQVALGPLGEGIRFVDREGHEIAPTLQIGALSPAPSGASIGLRYADQENAPELVTLTAELIDGEGRPVPQSNLDFDIARESDGQAFGRRLLGVLLSPSTPLLSAAAFLLALAFGQYAEAEKQRREEARERRKEEWEARQREAQEARQEARAQHQWERETRQREMQEAREQQQREAREARLSEIDRVAQLIPNRMEEAVSAYHELAQRCQVDPEWQGDAGLQQHLFQIWDRLRGHDWEGTLIRQAVRRISEDKAREAGPILHWFDKLQVSDENVEVVRCLEILRQLALAQEGEGSPGPVVQEQGIERVMKALNWASCEQTRHLGTLAERLVFGLAADQQYARLIEEQIKAGKLEARLLIRGSWPQLWPAPPPPAGDEVQRWLKAQNLAFHPFATERAEKEYRLPWYAVEEPLLEVQGAFPSILFGPVGSGKTAAALLLAHYCGNPRLEPHDRGSFPVFYRLRLARSQQDKVPPALVDLARATAREILKLLALRPASWHDLPPYRQRALLEFVRYAYRGARSLLEADLASLPASLLPHFSSSMPGGKVRLDSQSWIELCAAALPAGFDRFLWLVDVPGRWGRHLFKPTRQVLNDLLVWADHLASVDILLKLFVPVEFHQQLQRTAGLTETTLWWEEETLQKMLDERMRQVGKESLLELCDGRSVTQEHVQELIEQAANSPRRMVKLGAALLQSAASAPGRKILRVDFENARKRLERR